MADNIMGRRFFQPVYKDQTNPSNVGELIEAGDTLTVLLNAADGTHPTQNITVLSVSADNHEVFWEYDSGNQYLESGHVHSVHPNHQYACPEVADLCYVADEIVESFTINGGTAIEGPYALSDEGAAALQEAINTAIVGNGAATVVFDTDHLRIYIMNTTVTFAATLAEDGELVTCEEFDA